MKNIENIYAPLIYSN